MVMSSACGNLVRIRLITFSQISWMQFQQSDISVVKFMLSVLRICIRSVVILFGFQFRLLNQVSISLLFTRWYCGQRVTIFVIFSFVIFVMRGLFLVIKISTYFSSVKWVKCWVLFLALYKRAIDGRYFFIMILRRMLKSVFMFFRIQSQKRLFFGVNLKIFIVILVIQYNVFSLSMMM